MPVNIYIPDEQIDLLLDFYASELKGVKEKRTLLDKHEASIKSTIAQLRSKKYDIENNHTSNVPFAEKMRFQDDWTWAKKIEFAIGQARKAVTTNEIVDIPAMACREMMV